MALQSRRLCFWQRFCCPPVPPVERVLRQPCTGKNGCAFRPRWTQLGRSKGSFFLRQKQLWALMAKRTKDALAITKYTGWLIANCWAHSATDHERCTAQLYPIRVAISTTSQWWASGGRQLRWKPTEAKQQKRTVLLAFHVVRGRRDPPQERYQQHVWNSNMFLSIPMSSLVVSTFSRLCTSKKKGQRYNRAPNRRFSPPWSCSSWTRDSLTILLALTSCLAGLDDSTCLFDQLACVGQSCQSDKLLIPFHWIRVATPGALPPKGPGCFWLLQPRTRCVFLLTKLLLLMSGGVATLGISASKWHMSSSLPMTRMCFLAVRVATIRVRTSWLDNVSPSRPECAAPWRSGLPRACLGVARGLSVHPVEPFCRMSSGMLSLQGVLMCLPPPLWRHPLRRVWSHTRGGEESFLRLCRHVSGSFVSRREILFSSSNNTDFSLRTRLHEQIFSLFTLYSSLVLLTLLLVKLCCCLFTVRKISLGHSDFSIRISLVQRQVKLVKELELSRYTGLLH